MRRQIEDAIEFHTDGQPCCHLYRIRVFEELSEFREGGCSRERCVERLRAERIVAPTGSFSRRSAKPESGGIAQK
jgi:hypothetical protein